MSGWAVATKLVHKEGGVLRSSLVEVEDAKRAIELALLSRGVHKPILVLTMKGRLFCEDKVVFYHGSDHRLHWKCTWIRQLPVFTHDEWLNALIRR